MYKKKQTEIHLPVNSNCMAIFSECCRHEHITRTITANITFWHHKCWNTRCSNGRHKGIAFLVYVDTPMPATPRFGGCEHSPASTHIPKSSLTWTMSSTSTDARNTCHGTPGPPRFGASLMTYKPSITVGTVQPYLNRLHIWTFENYNSPASPFIEISWRRDSLGVTYILPY